MKIKTDSFKSIIKDLEPAVQKSSEIPILSHILVTNEFVQSYNSKIGCHITTDLFNEIDEPLCIPFIKLKAFILGTTSEITEINIDENNMNLKSGKSSAKIPYQSGKDFPEFIELIEKIMVSNKPVTNEICEGLKLCSFFVSKLKNIEIIQGVNLQSLRVQASDGKRIAMYTFKEEIIKINTVISIDFIKALKGSDSIYFEDDKIAIGNDNTIYFAPTIQGDFPPVEKYLPQVKSYIKLPIEEMRKSLKKIGDFSEDGIELARCTIQFENGIEIKYQGQTAHVKEFFDFGGKIKSKGFKLNPYHFEKLLSYCEKFSFVSVDSFDILYGSTEDDKFKCIMSLEKI